MDSPTIVAGGLSTVTELGKDEAWLHHRLSDLARRLGHWDKAVVHWEDLVRLDIAGPGLSCPGISPLPVGRG